jgi:hypothetical protein
MQHIALTVVWVEVEVVQPVAPDVRVAFTVNCAGRTLPAGALQVTEPVGQHT